MSDMLPAGQKMEVSLPDMVRPWIGCLVNVRFDNGTHGVARIQAVTETHAEIVTVGKETKQ